MTDEQERNKKLAAWAELGIKHSFKPIGFDNMVECIKCGSGKPPIFKYCNSPNFTQSLDACFELLVPKECSVAFNHSKGKVTCLLTIPKGKGFYGSNTFVGQTNSGEDALALCLAIEKIIDN